MIVGEADAGREDVHVIFSGITVSEVFHFVADVFEADAGRDGPLAETDAILREDGDGAGFAFAIVLASGRADVFADDGAVSVLFVDRVVLEAAFFVLVETDAEVEGVFDFAGVDGELGEVFDAVGFVFAVIGANAEAAGGVAAKDVEGGLAEAAREDAGGRKPSAGAGGIEADVVEFEPVSVEFVVVGGGGEAEVGVWLDDVAEVGAGLLGVHVVEPGGCVAAVGVAGEIVFGEAEVGFVEFEVGVSDFQFEALGDGGVGIPGEFEHRLVFREVAVGVVHAGAAVDVFKTVGAAVVVFDEEGEVSERGFDDVAVVGVEADVVVGAVDGFEVALASVGNGGGEVVDDAAGGFGSVHDLAGAFEDFDAAHASGGWGVVGGGGGIGGGAGDDAVFHHGDFGAAVGIGAAEAEVGEDAVAVFLAEVDTGNAADDAVDVVVVLVADFGFVDEGGGTGEEADVFLGADDACRLDLDDGGVFGRGFGGNFLLRVEAGCEGQQGDGHYVFGDRTIH